MNRPPATERFYSVFLSLFGYIKQINEELNEKGVEIISNGKMKLGEIFLMSQSKENIITSFIERTHPFWKREELLPSDSEESLTKKWNFLKTEGLSLILDLPEEYMNNFRELLNGEVDGQPIFTQERQAWICNKLSAMVKISISYVHVARRPVNGKYTVKYMDKVNVKEMVGLWQIKELDTPA